MIDYFPSADALVSEILATERLVEDFGFVDVRVQVISGTWYFHIGDSPYDTDHRGVWACGQVTAEELADPRPLAEHLLVRLEGAL